MLLNKKNLRKYYDFDDGAVDIAKLAGNIEGVFAVLAVYGAYKLTGYLIQKGYEIKRKRDSK